MKMFDGLRKLLSPPTKEASARVLSDVCTQCQFNGKYSSGASCLLDKPCKAPPHIIKKKRA